MVSKTTRSNPKMVRRLIHEKIKSSSGKTKNDLMKIRKEFNRQFNRMKEALDDTILRGKSAKKHSKRNLSAEKYNRVFANMHALVFQCHNDAKKHWQERIEKYCDSLIHMINRI